MVLDVEFASFRSAAKKSFAFGEPTELDRVYLTFNQNKFLAMTGSIVFLFNSGNQVNSSSCNANGNADSCSQWSSVARLDRLLA